MTNLAGTRRADLEAQRDFLLGSIADLERERAAGDLSEESFEELRADYVRRAADCLRAIEAMEASPAAAVGEVAASGAWHRFRRFLGRRRVRRALGAATLVCFLAVVGLFAAHLAGVRLPGQSPTGSVTLSQAAQVSQELTEATDEANSGQIPTAVLLYDQVLAKVPDQPEALTYRGWLTRLAGISGHSARTVRNGDADLAKVARVAPSYPDGEALDAVALYEDDHDPRAAVTCLARLLKDKPTSTLVGDVSSVARLAYAAAGVALPRAFGGS